ncbi:glycosyltransferase family 4 protein [Bythopirellula goksoeyrii]|uniref:D-inositol-3-phosphate glycosyltransferase n=1 Tax=Bythopirellula goksoeyrii TaxID=1400387 RepID=A0A5B9QFZ1_9BACT|nr:glycosyltransferase family 4 protein [Bythopirellula goksoeyrii]QEG37977.1 D-inositol-3-phosphate glycosyltransferase [Bythopirellula goksoeyrii]
MPHSIVHLIAEWSPFNAAAHLREVVCSQVQAGESVAVIILSANPNAQAEIDDLGATCIFVHRRWHLDPFALRECAIQLRSMHPRVVFFWGVRATEFASLARWTLPKAKLIATLPAESSSAGSWASQWLGNAAVLDHIVADYAKKPSEKTTVITPGVAAPTNSDLSHEELLAELKFPAEAQLITIAGPLTRSELIDEAIWNFELVRTLHPQACLVVLGDGPDRYRLERYARLVSDPTAIRFFKGVGSLFSQKTPDPFGLLKHSTLYWQPGRSTAIPTALLCAQALGIPVVANDTAPHAQVVTHGENGFLVPTKKRSFWTRHTVELLENLELHKQCSADARNVVEEHFSLANMLQAYDQLAKTTSPQHIAMNH